MVDFLPLVGVESGVLEVEVAQPLGAVFAVVDEGVFANDEVFYGVGSEEFVVGGEFVLDGFGLEVFPVGRDGVE